MVKSNWQLIERQPRTFGLPFYLMGRCLTFGSSPVILCIIYFLKKYLRMEGNLIIELTV